MKILFAGTPGIAVPSLDVLNRMELSGENLQICAVLSNPDSRRGRKRELLASEICTEAELLSENRVKNGFPPIKCLKFEKLNSAAREEIASLKPELLISFAYNKIFGPKFLLIFPMGGINIHPSLLPEYRGPSPITSAILERKNQSGISIQKIALEMDSGDILEQEIIPLNGRETTESLSSLVSQKAADMLFLLIKKMLGQKINSILQLKAHPQTGNIVYSHIIAKEQGRINWEKSAEEIDAQIRAFTPWPLSFTMRGEDVLFILEGKNCEKINVDFLNKKFEPGRVLGIDRDQGLLIQTGNGVYAAVKLQWEAKKALDFKDFLNGARNFCGALLC